MKSSNFPALHYEILIQTKQGSMKDNGIYMIIICKAPATSHCIDSR